MSNKIYLIRCVCLLRLNNKLLSEPSAVLENIGPMLWPYLLIGVDGLIFSMARETTATLVGILSRGTRPMLALNLPAFNQ